MAYWGSFTRVNIIAIFLFSTLLFSSVANASYESFAFSSNTKSKNNLDYIETARTGKFVQQTLVNHSISLSESMNLSSPEEKKDLGTASIEDQKNIKSMIFEEELDLSSDLFQQETTVVLVKQFSDRKGIMERILPIDRIRNQEKSPNKNYLDTDLQLIISDYNFQMNKQEPFGNLLFNSIINDNFDNFISNSFDTFSKEIFIHDFKIQQFLDLINVIPNLELSDSLFNQINSKEPTGIIILVLISGLIFIQNENNHIKFNNFRKFFSYIFIILLVSSGIITPISISSSYWGAAFGEEMNSNNPNSTESNDHQINSSENYTELIPENYTTSISNYTELIPENYTTSTDILESNSTKNELEHKIILPNATESWKFDSYVNGSHFVGNVHIEEESGLILDGDSYVTNDGNSTNSLSNLTITAWVKPYYSNGSSEFTIVSKERTFELIINNKIAPQQVAKFSIFDGIQWHSVETSTTLGESWSHLAATFNGTKLSVYTNGTLSNEKSTTNIITLTIDGQFEPKTPGLVSSSSDIVIGASLDNARSVDDVSKKFSGEIYDVNIFDVYLTAAQIAKLYNDSFPFIIENSNSTITVEIIEDIPIEELKTIDLLEEISSIGLDNATKIDNISNNTDYDTRIEFNGTENFVTINEEELNEDLNQLTISAFIKPNYTTGSAEFTVLSKENSFVLSLNNILSPEHIPKFSVFDGISWTDVIGSTKIEEWSHLVAIINNTRISLYVNGTLEGSAQLSEPIFISGDKLQLTTSDVMVSDSDLILGAYLSTTRGESNLSKYFSGLIDEVFIYKEALTELQIQEIYSHFIEQLESKLEPALLLPIELQNTTSTLSHNEIVIGTPVNWIQTIVLNESNKNNIQIELPADAENIQAEIITSNDQSFKIPPENLEITESLLESTELIPLDIVTMEKIDEILQDNKDTKFVMINESASEYMLEFETPAPYTIEEDYSNDDVFNKTVTVAHDSALHYTDVKSYSDIPEDLVEKGMEFSLYWNINGTITDVTIDPRFQVEFIDTNGNDIVDQMMWIVPQLSEQVFQIVCNKNISADGINIRISQNSDDAEQKSNGEMDLNDKSDLDIAENQIGLRFQNINIPQGSIITKAYIQFTAKNNDEEDSAGVDIFAENVANANTFSKFKFDITNRIKTTASVDWYIPEWEKEGNAGTAQRTPDISALVQEVVNRNDWSKGNAIAFMLLINNHGERDALTYDGNPQKSPLLHIEFSNAQNIILNGLIRDFKFSHPDFEYIIGDDDGIVKSLLGDGNGAESDNPAHAKIGATKTTTSADNFNQWYKNFENINKCKEFDITLVPNNAGDTDENGDAEDTDEEGLFEFSDTTFFPIDGELFGNEGRAHNYHFTYEMRGTFEFGKGQTIQVNGDDDVWIFVNHKLIYDGGGVLPPRDSGLLELDSLNVSKSLGLVAGQKYDIDIFFAERHTVLSVFEIETNINIIQKNLRCDAQDFKITLPETLEFDTEFDFTKINGVIIVTLDETLTLQDTSFNTDQTKQVTLNETLTMQDATFTKQDIQLTLDEKLTLQDTSIRLNDLVLVILDEVLNFQDTAFNIIQSKQIELIETLNLEDTSQLISVDGIFVLHLDETLDLKDTKFNTQPNAVNDNSITPEDTIVIINVLANDSDLDGDPIVISSFDTTSTNGGTVILDDNGTPLDDTDDPLVYTPTTNFNGVDTFTYIISDGNGGFDTATVTITVTDVNDLPVANNDSAITPQNIAVPINVLANDFDVDGTINPTTVSIISGPLSGTVSVNSITGMVTYNPNTGFVGTVTFVYSVADDDGDTDTATVTVIITSPPEAGGDPGGGGGGSGGGGSGGGGATSTTSPGLPGIIGPAAAGTAGGGSTKFHDVTVEIGSGGKIKAANAGGSCVDTHQTIKVSSIVESLSPLKRVELRFVHEGEPLEDYTAIRMQITNMTIGENLYSVSGSIPWELMSGSYGVRYWLHALNEDLEISDSTKYLISVKPGYSILGNLEFDVVTIKAEGSTLKPIAYFTNTISKPVSGAISLIVDGKVVDTSQPQSFEPGETSVPLVWKIPRVGTVVDYQLNVIAEFCGKIFETEEITLSTFPRTVIEPIPDKINIKLFTDKLGNTVARPGSLYSSDSNPNTSFRVVSPDGTCVIGHSDECIIRDSTFGKSGNIESVTIDGQIYRIRYSGAENVVERFTITSVDPILGYWNVYKETPEGMIPKAYAENENPLKIQYRAQELKINTAHDINFQEVKPLEEQETIEFGGKITSQADQPIKFFDITVELLNPSAELKTVLVHLSPTKIVSASEAFKESLDGKPLTVSAVVQKPINFNRAELRFVNSYQNYDEYSAIKMVIDDLPGNPSLSIISASIPWALISKGPIAVYWIQLQGDVIRESDKFKINVGKEYPFDYEENQNLPLVPQTLGTFVRLTSINPNTIDKADNKTPSIDIKGELDNWTDLEGYPIVDIFAPNGQKIWNDIVLNNANQKNSDVWEFTRNNFRVGLLSELPTGEYLIEMSSSKDIRKDSLGIPLKSQMSFVIDDSNSGMGGLLKNDVPPSIDVPTDGDRNTIFGIIIFVIVALISSIIAIIIKYRYQNINKIHPN